MKVKIRDGYIKSKGSELPDVRVVIDVYRASTTTLAILEKAPTDFLVTNKLEILKELSKSGYRVVSEVFDLGIDNSPTQVRDLMKSSEKVVLKTTNLTTAIEENFFDRPVFIGCFNNLSAIVSFLKSGKFQNVEILPAGQMNQEIEMPEDSHCAELMMERLVSNTIRQPDLNLLLGFMKYPEKVHKLPKHYVEDLQLAVQLDLSSNIPQVFYQQEGIFSVKAI